MIIEDKCECGELISIEIDSKCSSRADGKRPFYPDAEMSERSNRLRCRKCSGWIADTVPSAAHSITTH